MGVGKEVSDRHFLLPPCHRWEATNTNWSSVNSI